MTLPALKQLQNDLHPPKSRIAFIFQSGGMWRKIPHLFWHGRNKIPKARWNEEGEAELRRCLSNSNHGQRKGKPIIKVHKKGDSQPKVI
jgi:hypothetical protein